MLSSNKVSIDSLLPGQSADSDILDVTVISNNPYGYKLTGTVGSADYTADALYNTADTTKTFSNIGFGTNKSTLNDFDNDTWGYSYSTDGGTTWLGNNGNTGYTGLPLYNTQNTVTFLDTDDISAADGDTMQFKIGAKASSSKASGEYNNTINFVATGYSYPLYTVTYNANGGTVSPASDSVRGTGASVTLPTPTNGTKIFGGWCDGTVASSACTGTTYQAGVSYTPTNNVTLTAMWQASVLADITRMDEMTPTICANTATGASKDLIDDRGTSGTQTYTIKKLNDGKCWMTQNMRLTYAGDSSLAVSDGSGGTTTWITPSGYGTGTWSDEYDKARSYNSGNATYGVYYNWPAATAETDDSSVSICPKGWRLPKNTAGVGSWYTLYQNYNSYSLMRTGDPALVLAGHYSTGSISNYGSEGRYWSNATGGTFAGGSTAYFLWMDNSSVAPQYNTFTYDGASVRCVSI